MKEGDGNEKGQLEGRAVSREENIFGMKKQKGKEREDEEEGGELGKCGAGGR